MTQHIVEVPTVNVPRIRIIYDFVSPAEENYLVQKVNAVGGDSNKLWGWKELNGRRSMYWGGAVTPSATLIPSAFPPFMDKSWPNVLQRITDTGAFDVFSREARGKGKGPNHCLVNEYLPGQGIFPHTDGPAYCPLVATLSLGSHTILTLTPRLTTTNESAAPVPHLPEPSKPTSAPSAEDPSSLSIFLPPRSLVILSNDLYSNYLHGIASDIKVDSMDSLRECANWDSYWEAEGSQAVHPMSQGPVCEGAEGSHEEVGKLAVQNVVARRKIVEAGAGWERTTRLSLTCRRVDKVRKGIKLG